MAAVAYWNIDSSTTTISTYNIFSKTHIHSHHISEGHIVAPIWTHGDCVQFVTVKTESITIWEAGFTSIYKPVGVRSLPAPGSASYLEECLFLPALSWLAFSFQKTVLIWDAQNSKLLLNFLGERQATRMTFSSDGHIFAYGTTSRGVYLWEESPNGYILQKIIPSSHRIIGPLLSPNGESIIIPNKLKILLWRIADLLPTTSSISTEPAEQTNFILEFSPGEILAAVARLQEYTAIVLNLKSGDPQLIIDTGMRILGLRVTESTVIVVGEGKIVTWNLPIEAHTLNTRVNIDNSVQTTMFNYLAWPDHGSVSCISISPNSNYVALAQDTLGEYLGINIYDVVTGRCLTGTRTEGYMPWFSPDGDEVWCKCGDSVEGWTIIKDTESDLIKLEPLGPTVYPSGGFPWQSSHGHKVMDNGWVVNSSGKRLLWLPHCWRLDEVEKVWRGQFLGLLHRELPEAVVLEVDE